MMVADKSKLVFIPLDELTKAHGMVEVYRNYYCLVDPEQGVILYQLEPQRKGSLTGARLMGNQNEEITKRIHGMHYPWAEIRLIDSIHVPINPSDY